MAYNLPLMKEDPQEDLVEDGATVNLTKKVFA